LPSPTRVLMSMPSIIASFRQTLRLLPLSIATVPAQEDPVPGSALELDREEGFTPECLSEFNELVNAFLIDVERLGPMALASIAR